MINLLDRSGLNNFYLQSTSCAISIISSPLYLIQAPKRWCILIEFWPELGNVYLPNLCQFLLKILETSLPYFFHGLYVLLDGWLDVTGVQRDGSEGVERGSSRTRRTCIHIMDRARILPGQDTRSRGVSRRIDQRIMGYTQSAGFEGCIESWICARRKCACARTRPVTACALCSRLDYGSWEEAISEIPGETDSSMQPGPRRIIEKSKRKSRIEIGRINADRFRIKWNSSFPFRDNTLGNLHLSKWMTLRIYGWLVWCVSHVVSE